MTNIISTRRFLKGVLPLLMVCGAVWGPETSARADNESNISGALDYTMASMTATLDPNVFVLAGSFVVVTATGAVNGTDTTLWNIATGQFTDIGRFTGGTGSYHDAEGKITIAGTFDIVAGTGQSNYFGKLETD